MTHTHTYRHTHTYTHTYRQCMRTLTHTHIHTLTTRRRGPHVTPQWKVSLGPPNAPCPGLLPLEVAERRPAPHGHPRAHSPSHPGIIPEEQGEPTTSDRRRPTRRRKASSAPRATGPGYPGTSSGGPLCCCRRIGRGIGSSSPERAPPSPVPGNSRLCSRSSPRPSGWARVWVPARPEASLVPPGLLLVVLSGRSYS